ncbi:arabinose operon transcriptional regulator AraC [Candidatus Pantoea multigeneris]|uniref:Arabinose operon regulatory protein n=1 Tax=Candidatus Pantoea multigeneris TaxID=2608357 RepID=A0ABX0REU8_9GAMM|nr:arabinose operon transcriptional regulator AraC [Pantoea multigeneris]NIF23577.1 arabinose operon transcriptional regulator AraC [Pantoea multigeneris]
MMHQRSPSDIQSNPLLPGYPFNAWLVAGLTPVTASGALDFFIDRPLGMKGYILNLTIKGRGQVFKGAEMFHCEPGDMLLFEPETPHYYGRAHNCTSWFHRWIYFRPRSYWIDWLSWEDKVQGVGRLRLTEEHLAEFDKIFSHIEEANNSGRRFAEEVAMNLLERLLLRAVEEDPRSREKIRDPRVIEACQYINRHLASDDKIEDIASHVCLSPSRLTHLFSEQMGINLLRWREEQRIIRARLLLQTTKESVAGIGREVGYDDQLYFSRIFRKRVGVSPSEYRRQSLEGEETADNVETTDEVGEEVTEEPIRALS